MKRFRLFRALIFCMSMICLLALPLIAEPGSTDPMFSQEASLYQMTGLSHYAREGPKVEAANNAYSPYYTLFTTVPAAIAGIPGDLVLGTESDSVLPALSLFNKRFNLPILYSGEAVSYPGTTTSFYMALFCISLTPVITWRFRQSNRVRDSAGKVSFDHNRICSRKCQKDALRAVHLAVA